MTDPAQRDDDLDPAIFSTIPEAIDEIRAAASCWSSTTPTVRTRAISSWPRSRARPRSSTSWSPTAEASCLPCAAWRLDELGIPQMVTETTGGHEAAFTVSIDYRHGTTTGTSAYDRAVTARAITDPGVSPQDFQKPGHVFPLRARTAACFDAQGTPRPPSTSPRWRACSRPA